MRKKYSIFIILIICFLTLIVGCGKSSDTSLKSDKNKKNEAIQSNFSNSTDSAINNSEVSNNNSIAFNNSNASISNNVSTSNQSSTSSIAKSNTSPNSKSAQQPSQNKDGTNQQSQSAISDNKQVTPQQSSSAAVAVPATPKQNQSSQAVVPKPTEPATETFTGYITTEDDFAAGLHEDTAFMIYMRLMALSGLGITFQQDGKWVFYYIDGNISTDNKKDNGKWTFDGTGSQLEAWKIVEAQVKENNGSNKMKPVPVTITGVFKGNVQTNPGPDADGREFPVITVKSMSKN